jgi:hypothetical protein
MAGEPGDLGKCLCIHPVGAHLQDLVMTIPRATLSSRERPAPADFLQLCLAPFFALLSCYILQSHHSISLFSYDIEDHQAIN